jgi:hypothetical protein
MEVPPGEFAKSRQARAKAAAAAGASAWQHGSQAQDVPVPWLFGGFRRVLVRSESLPDRE